MANRTSHTLWVCVDCYYAHHGVLEDYDGDDAKLLSLIPEGAEVTAGLVDGEHGCTPVDAYGDPIPEDTFTECECETQTFSRSTCQGCGSHLGGSRHALTVWEDDDES